MNLSCEVTDWKRDGCFGGGLFFFKKMVGGTKDLFLFERFEKCNEMAMCLQAGLSYYLTRRE